MTNANNATFVGVWPLGDAPHDPALDALTLPEGAALWALCDADYRKFDAPAAIAGLSRAASLAELENGKWCVIMVNGFDYVVALTDNPDSVVVEMGDAQKTEWTEAVRIYNFPDCKMVSSGDGLFGDENFDRFDAWFSKQTVFPLIYPFDFLGDGKTPGTFCWYYVYDERMDVPAEFEIVDFKGGYYAVITGVDAGEFSSVMQTRDEYLAKHNLVIDETRSEFGHILSGIKLIKETLGAGQMDYWLPVKRMGE
jgi:AraC family transcriptional regulator